MPKYQPFTKNTRVCKQRIRRQSVHTGASLVVLLLFQFCSYAQTELTGTAYNKLTDSMLPGVNIWNLSKGKGGVANSRGQYHIDAGENDKIIFSHQGYRNDTIVVEFSHLKLGYNPNMTMAQQTLEAVYVDEAYYKRDSIQRRLDNKEIYDMSEKKLVSRSGPTDGVGVAISPGSFFSKKNQELKKTKERLEEEEEQAYVDFRFSESWVAYLTKLKGQDLRDFMFSYRPSYKFCRKNDKLKMQKYIMTKLEEYHAGKRKTS